MAIEIRTPEEIASDREKNQDQSVGPTDPRIIYYGPHPCKECGARICRVAEEQGGDEFDYPEEPIYPNSEWKEHVCPKKV